jgi:DNA-binding CsgD family transcriptional regulator/PAS domain-containing protein
MMPGAYTRLYESLDRAALDPAAWRDVCDGLGELVGATGALMIPYDLDSRIIDLMPHSASLEETLASFFETGWYKRDFRSRGFPKAISTGFVTDQELITPEEMRRHPYYAEWLASVNLKWFAGLSFNVDGKTWGAAIHGTEARGPFLAHDIERLMRVRDGLTMAARRAAAVGHKRSASIQDAFSASNRGVAVLDWSGGIIWQNERAESLLRSADLVARRRIGRRDETISSRLSSLIDRALGFRAASGEAMPGPVEIMLHDGRSMVIDAVPMPRDFQSLLTGASVIVTVHEVSVLHPGQDLHLRFGLTKREMQLAGHMMQGESLPFAASAMGISLSTVRQYVKQMLAKTHTHRQAELVALLVRQDS